MLPSGTLPLARDYLAALLEETRAQRTSVLVADGRVVLQVDHMSKKKENEQKGCRRLVAPPVLVVDRSVYYPSLLEVGCRHVAGVF